MYVVHKASNEKHSVLIKELEDQDWKKITIKQFAFNWKKLKGIYKIFKLSLDGEILGLTALNIVEPEERIEIALLAISSENIGKEKKFDRIAGTLIAFTCKEAIRNIIGNSLVYPSYPKQKLKRITLKNRVCWMVADNCTWKMFHCTKL